METTMVFVLQAWQGKQHGKVLWGTRERHMNLAWVFRDCL